MEQYLFLGFIGISILLSILMAKGVSLFHAPMVLGYILAGAIIGQTVYLLHIDVKYETFDLINSITLSLLGLGIGTELKITDLKKLGSGIIMIVIFEATMAFLLVGVVVYLVTNSISLGIIYGALASATAPAGTTDVINQYKASGNLTKTLYAVMGLDDIYALLLYSIAIPVAIILLGSHELTVGHALLNAAKELVLAIGIGIASGFFVVWLTKKIHDNIIMLLFALGMLFINCAVAIGLEISPILLNMCVGIVLVNRSSLLSRKLNASLSSWSPPIYVIFFVLIGTKLDLHVMYAEWVLIILYIISRTCGKWIGAFLGCKVSHAPKLTTKYLGFTLLSQAGVAIGLTLSAAHYLIKADPVNYTAAAGTLVSVMVGTTFLIMLVGPVMAKYGLKKAGEIKKLS